MATVDYMKATSNCINFVLDSARTSQNLRVSILCFCRRLWKDEHVCLIFHLMITDKVTGGNMPPPPLVELLMKFMSFLQMGGVIVVVLGSNVFRLLGFSQVPSWYNKIEKNGFQLAIFVYLLLPQMLSKYLVSRNRSKTTIRK